MRGHAFFICDNHPVNNFQFIKEVQHHRILTTAHTRQALDSPDLFWLKVPTPVMYAFAAATEAVHRVVARVVPFEPMLTKAEVCKVGVTHYMSTANAQARAS